jgi:hypothetical protein
LTQLDLLRTHQQPTDPHDSGSSVLIDELGPQETAEHSHEFGLAFFGFYEPKISVVKLTGKTRKLTIRTDVRYAQAERTNP